MRYQIRNAKLRLGETMRRMMRTLRYDVYPLMQDDACDSTCHQPDAAIMIEAEGFSAEYHANAAAFHMGEGSDVPVAASNPAQFTNRQRQGFVHNNRSWARRSRAFAMQNDRNGFAPDEANASDHVSTNDPNLLIHTLA